MYSWNNKKWRQLFYINKDIICSGKSYPYFSKDITLYLLDEIKKTNPLLFGGLYGSKAYIDGGRVLIDSKLEQFRSMINEDPSLKDLVKASIKKVLGKAYNIGPYKAPKKEEIDPLIAFTNSLK